MGKSQSGEAEPAVRSESGEQIVLFNKTHQVLLLTGKKFERVEIPPKSRLKIQRSALSEEMKAHITLGSLEVE